MMKRFLIFIGLILALVSSMDAQHMGKLVQSIAKDVKIGPFTDSAGAAQTGLTLSQADIRLAKNDGAWAQKNQASSCTHEENGYYECSLNTTDTNTTGILLLAVNESGALPVWHIYEVVPQSSYDLLVTGNVATGSDVWNTATASVTAGIGLQIKNNVDIPASDAGGVVHRGTAQAGSATTITLDTGASATDNYYRWKRIVIRSGTGAGQTAIITGYTGSTKVATIACEGTTGAWVTNPNSTSAFVIQPRNR